MRIGVLTFHAQQNYGGVLQCWALVEALRLLGHDVRVVDRWLDADNASLVGPIGLVGVRGWLYIVGHGLAGCGWLTLLLRQFRTIRFVRAIGLTDYHFRSWREAPADLGVDCLVVGSDQVWNGAAWNDADIYLLKGAPACRAIAYAASFGMRELPEGTDYPGGFRRFSAISVREREGVSLVAGTGYPGPVAHTVDPTLLLPRKSWERLAPARRKTRRMVCYFLNEDVNRALRVLEPFARDRRWRVTVLCNPQPKFPLPDTVAGVLRQLGTRCRQVFGPGRVKVAAWYGPKEFVRAFSRADACITDSFHAVMFSYLYDVNVRVLRPETPERLAMFSRIEEFADACMKGNVIVRDLPSALASLERDPRVAFRKREVLDRCERSRKWLEDALAAVAEERETS